MEGSDGEDLLRQLAPQVLGAVVRRYGHFDLAEDATQESLVAAATQWPRDGWPENPKAWLISVAARRLTDLLRADQARRRREQVVSAWPMTATSAAGPTDADDSLVVLLLCCHPSLPAASQIALTLRAVGGLRVSEIARALLTSEATVTRRITRAKETIRRSGIPFSLPVEEEWPRRLAAVLRVLYLIFNEGYASTDGSSLLRLPLADEAVRLTRMLHQALPDDAEVGGLLALMLLTHARRRARTRPDGLLVPMAQQDRRLWDGEEIGEGTGLLTAALRRGPPGPYQLQAAIAALHDEADSQETTDWAQIAALYERLLRYDGNPVVALNRAVAVSMVQGPQAGLDLLDGLGGDPRMRGDRRFHAVRARLLERTGDLANALDAYGRAERLATNQVHHRYLNDQIRRIRAALPATDDSDDRSPSEE